MPPTYHVFPEFWRDYERLSPDQRERFRTAVDDLVEDLDNGDGFRKGLRVKGVRGRDGIFEMTWDMANNGRATFNYGTSIRDGLPHIEWRGVGDKSIL